MYLKKIHTSMEKIINQTLSEQDITVSQWHYLNYLYSLGGEHIHLKDLEYHFGVSQPTVAGILKRMAAKGLVYVEKADYATNSKDVTLTQSGRKICEYGLKKKKFVDELLLQPLNEEERKAFQVILEKIYESVSNYESHAKT